MGKTGIYLILSKSTNRKYVGLSIDIDKRYKQHLYLLEKGRHHNRNLQELYNQNGETDLEHSIIELVGNKELLYKREQFHINRFKADINATKGSNRLRKLSRRNVYFEYITTRTIEIEYFSSSETDTVDLENGFVETPFLKNAILNLSKYQTFNYLKDKVNYINRKLPDILEIVFLDDSNVLEFCTK